MSTMPETEPSEDMKYFSIIGMALACVGLSACVISYDHLWGVFWYSAGMAVTAFGVFLVIVAVMVGR